MNRKAQLRSDVIFQFKIKESLSCEIKIYGIFYLYNYSIGGMPTKGANHREAQRGKNSDI